MEAVNAQAALIWDASDNVRWHTSLSSRTRFPTLFERFSARFGTAIPNPDVDPERATNFEVGGAFEFPSAKARLAGAAFYSDIKDALIQIPVALGPPFGTVNQTKNAGDGKYMGFEVEFSAEVAGYLDIGANVTAIDRDFTDPTNGAFEAQGVPGLKAFAWGDWRVLSNLTVTPSVEFASERYTVTSSASITPPRFYQTGAYTLLNLAVNWNVSDNVSLLFGGKNLTDENYTLVDGFPEEGRNFSVSLRLRN
jgi:iron complex outermembrane receptor protein